MHDIRIRPRARDDLKAIWRYTFQKWGERQADLYLQQIDQVVRSLAEFPEIGVPCDHIRAGYRKLQFNRHLIFHRLPVQRIEIIRVLHQTMDVEAHL